jgi:hypothetical protein
MKTVPLFNTDHVALVDDEHFDAVMRYRWVMRKSRNGVLYAHTTALRTLNGMHNIVAGLCGMTGPLIDHRNRDGLDNQSGNLRPATTAQNAWNHARATGASGHPCVHKNRGAWAVRFDHNGQRMYFGTHQDLGEAKEIATRELLRLRGEFAPEHLKNAL